LASFVRRRLGGEALAKIAEPLLSGICVSDPERTSLKSSFPWLMDVEREYGSLIRGMRAVRRTTSRSDNGARPKLPMFMSLRGGMRQLVDALAGKLDPDAVCAGREVTDVESLNRHGPPYRLKLRNGAPLEADAMILTTPSDVSSRLLKQFDPTLAEELAAIRYVSTAVVALGYRPHNGLAPLNGFGLVIPKAEHRRIIGCTWSSAKFDHRAPKDHKLVHCFAGGPAYEGMVDLADGVLIQVVREELAGIMALRAAPDLVRVYRWVKANPLYDLGHLDRVEAMRRRAAEHGGLFLAGSSFDGAGVPDCVRQGQEAADAILAGLRCIVPQALAYHS
jgi:oxygen-dependent protoporphyrinogen oxidase